MTDQGMFLHKAEVEAIRMLARWNGIETTLTARERLAVELAVLMKLAALIARDGLHVGVDVLHDTLATIWEKEKETRHSEQDNQPSVNG